MAADPAGAALVRLAARLVPAWRRAAWTAEWLGELAWAERAGAARAALWLRALGAFRDASWIRGRQRRRAVLTGDLRHALRALRRRPWYAGAVVLTLAAGIGGATAIFSVVDAVLLRPLPYPNADRLMQVWRFSGEYAVPDVKPEQLDGWRRQTDLFASIAEWSTLEGIVTGRGEPTVASGALLTAEAFPLLGLRPLRGRSFTAEDVAQGAAVVVISEVFWRSRLGGRSDVVGSMLELNGEAREIIGVMPRALRFPSGSTAFWLPLEASSTRPRRGLALLRAGVTQTTAQARIDDVSEQLQEAAPLPSGWRVLLRPVDDRALVGGEHRMLRVLGLAVLAVLLIACANAANLLLVEGAARSREIAVRGALGATRGQIARLLLTECLVLAVLAAGLGVVLAVAGVRVLQAIAPISYAVFGPNDFRVDARVLGFAAGLAVLTGLVFGTGPALVASGRRMRLTSTERSATGSRGLRRTRALLAGAELALAMMLLVSASLLLRSFGSLMSVDLGIGAEQLVIVGLKVPEHRYRDADSHVRLFTDVAERLRRLPGVTGVTVAESLPPDAGFSFGISLQAEGAPAPAEGQPELLPISSVDDAFFDVLGIPLIAGRGFDARDAAAAEPVAIIDPGLARLLWPDTEPAGVIGRRFRLDGEGQWLSVAGVAGDVRMLGLPGSHTAAGCAAAGCEFEVYRPLRQLSRRSPHEIAIRAQGDAGALAGAIREVVWSVDPTVPVRALNSMEQRLSDTLQEPRFVLRLVVAFTIVAVLLAALGVYAVLAYAVAQRTREFGVRVALGARHADVIRLVVNGGVRLALAGVGAGALLGLAAARVLRSLLHEIGPGDPLSLLAAATILGSVAVLAAVLPARRAMRIDPLEALRYE